MPTQDQTPKPAIAENEALPRRETSAYSARWTEPHDV